MAAKSRERSAAGRDLGELPPVVDPVRREGCRRDFRRFCESYHPARFPLAWSTDHLTAISRIETAVISGGQFAFAMPRGSGKSSLCITAAEWALMYGHRRFVMLVGATEPHAEEMLSGLKVSFETNDSLLADFPEVCFPIRRLDGIAHRANGQTIGGEPTRIGWLAKEVQLPVVAGSVAAGSVVRVAGITGRIRGASAALPDGTTIRPDLVLCDDPSTDESSTSPVQNATRERILAGAVLGLAGPGKKIAAVMPCTVISPGDLADRVLDRNRNPAWRGERSRMLYGTPQHPDLWDEYAKLRRASLADGRDGTDATEFYRANRAEMDAGLTAAWPARFNPDELSAVQSAMNLKIANPRAFAAEYQNDPEPDKETAKSLAIDADAVSRRLTRLARGVVPAAATRLTAFVDAGGEVLWYALCAFDERFGGSVVDYGTFPRQNRRYFAKADARPALSDAFPGLSEEARLYAGLKQVFADLLGREYPRAGGGLGVRVDRLLVDSGWKPEAVHAAVRQSPFAPLITASKGYAIGAKLRPMGSWAPKPGEKPGWHWRLGAPGKGRLLTFDPHHWKTFVLERLTCPEGTAGAVQLPGDDPGEHQLLADHLASEYATRVTGNGRTVQEWSLRPGRDNDFFDACVGCFVAASVAGLAWDPGVAAGDEAPAGKGPRKRRSMAAAREAAREVKR